LDKDPIYIISSVCGLDKRGPLTDQQRAIYDKIMPSVNGIFEVLRIKNLPEEQKAAILFIIRLLIVFKIMFMMELFKNKRTRIKTDEKNIQDALRDINTVGRA
jgi:hypothetical protein